MPSFAAGSKSIARRFLKAATQQLSNANLARAMASAEEPDDIRALLARQHGFEALKDMAEAVLQPADSGEQARKLLMGLADRMRALEHSSAADLPDAVRQHADMVHRGARLQGAMSFWGEACSLILPAWTYLPACTLLDHA